MYINTQNILSFSFDTQEWSIFLYLIDKSNPQDDWLKHES